MFSLNDQPKDNSLDSNQVMTTAMGAIHDMLMEPMKEKLTPEEHGVLTLIGITFKIMAEKATAYEKMEQGEIPSHQKTFDPTKNDFSRN